MVKQLNHNSEANQDGRVDQTKEGYGRVGCIAHTLPWQSYSILGQLDSNEKNCMQMKETAMRGRVAASWRQFWEKFAMQTKIIKRG